MDNLEDVDLLEHRLRNLNGDLYHTLVDLKLSGALSLADLLHFEEQIVDGVAAALYHLRIDRGQLFPEPTDDDLDSIDPGGDCGAPLLTGCGKWSSPGGSDAELARAALHRLYIEHRKLEEGQR